MFAISGETTGNCKIFNISEWHLPFFKFQNIWSLHIREETSEIFVIEVTFHEFFQTMKLVKALYNQLTLRYSLQELDRSLYIIPVGRYSTIELWKEKKRKKIKEFHNRPGVAQRVPGGLGSQISWHLAHKGGEVVSLTHRPPIPPGMFLVLIFTRGWVDSPGHGTVWRRYVTEKSSNTTGNRSRGGPTTSAAP
jgi:hypothetical protein